MNKFNMSELLDFSGGKVLKQRCSGKRAFTIVELLVVIVIIAIILSFSLPMYSRYRRNAGLVVAKNMAKNLEVAIRAYEEEFKEWPGPGGLLQEQVVAKLTGDNDRNLLFYETDDDKIVPPGAGNTGNPFEFRVDDNYNNTVQGPDGPLNRTVIVWVEYLDDKGEVIGVVKSWE